jgi:hypothetical protein
MGALARDAQFGGDVSDGSAASKDPFDQQDTTMNGQTSISVGHEDLRGLAETSDISTKPGGPPIHKT